MKKHGFKELTEEWWHFTLVDEPFPETYFDFDIIWFIAQMEKSL